MSRPCWLGGHEWRIEHRGLSLHVGTVNERRFNVITCTRCNKAKVSYGSYPPRRMPSAPPQQSST